MNYDQLIETITPEIYQNLKTAVELGRWPDGSKVTGEQREHSMQAVIAYEAKHFPEHQRSGYVEAKKKTECGNDSSKKDDDEALKWT